MLLRFSVAEMSFVEALVSCPLVIYVIVKLITVGMGVWRIQKKIQYSLRQEYKIGGRYEVVVKEAGAP